MLHYGLIYTVDNTNYTFDKHWHYDFDATACPPWDMTTDHPKRGMFPHPPRASSFTTKVSHPELQKMPAKCTREMVIAFGMQRDVTAKPCHACTICGVHCIWKSAWVLFCAVAVEHQFRHPCDVDRASAFLQNLYCATSPLHG